MVPATGRKCSFPLLLDWSLEAHGQYKGESLRALNVQLKYSLGNSKNAQRPKLLEHYFLERGSHYIFLVPTQNHGNS